jgi:hypothetical protein
MPSLRLAKQTGRSIAKARDAGKVNEPSLKSWPIQSHGATEKWIDRSWCWVRKLTKIVSEQSQALINTKTKANTGKGVV